MKLVVLGILGVAALIATVVALPTGRSRTSSPAVPASRPLPAGGELALVTADGPLALADLRGRVVILSAGYTACPDVCPATLTTLAAALRALPAAELDQVTPLFVTLDPERDTVERVTGYARYFHPAIRGATAAPAALDDLATGYEISFARSVDTAGGTYWIDHSAEFHVIDRAGRPAYRLPHEVAPAALAAAVSRVLAAAAPVPAPAPSIRVVDPYVRMVPPESPSSAAFLRLHNPTSTDRAIVAASSAIAARVELHTHLHDGGVMRMRQVDRIPVPAHGDALLEPGGFHVMLIDLVRPLALGETIAIELVLDDGERVSIAAPVRAP